MGEADGRVGERRGGCGSRLYLGGCTLFRFGGGGGGFAPDFAGVLVFAEAEEGGLAELLIGGPGGEADLGDQGGLNPDGSAFGLGGGAEEGCRPGFERLETLAELGGELVGEAGAGASGIDKLARLFVGRCLVVADQECAEAGAAGVALAGEGIAADHELLLMEALALEPVGTAGGSIGAVGALRNDALGVELAGLVEHGDAGGREVLGELEVVGVGGLKEVGKELFAVKQRKVARVAAFEVEEIEAKVGKGVAGAFLEGGLQVGEVGGAVRGEDHDLAIEGGGLDGEFGDGGGNGADALGPVQSAASQHLDGFAVLAGLHAVAVELQLVDPLRAFGRVFGFLG